MSTNLNALWNVFYCPLDGLASCACNGVVSSTHSSARDDQCLAVSPSWRIARFRSPLTTGELIDPSYDVVY